MRSRVVTLNIWNEEGDSARRLELITRELRALRPDQLALQEVVHNSKSSRSPILTPGTARTCRPIIAGDFNASPDSASIRYLTGLQSIGGRSVCYHDAWAIAGDGPGHTWSADNPCTTTEIEKIVRQPGHRRRIDYVFVGSWDAHPKAYCRVDTVCLGFNQPSDGIWPSDHFGVVADLDAGYSSTE